MDNIKVSVIYPVYNAQEYIEKNLTSILNQTLKEIEIIVIYSPSVDDTEKIIIEFSKKHSKIKCIYNNDKKPISSIRNQGLKSAGGEYISFIDADDSVDGDYLEKLYAKAKSGDFDIVFSNRVNIRLSKIQPYYVWEFTEDRLNIDDVNREFVLRGVYKNKLVVWGRIMKREFIEKNDILFFNDLFGGEDLAFSLLFFTYAKNIAYVNDVMYYHAVGLKNSLSSNLELMVENTLKGLKELKDLFAARGFKQSLIVSAVCIPATDILIGYFDNWNTGLFSRLSIASVKKNFGFLKENIISLISFSHLENINKSKVLKFKYKIFAFAVKNNLYFVPRLVRIVRNLLRIVIPKRLCK